jgi:hypothetical protein
MVFEEAMRKYDAKNLLASQEVGAHCAAVV